MTPETRQAVEQLIDAAKGSLSNVQTMIREMPDDADREGVNALQQWSHNLQLAIDDAAQCNLFGTDEGGIA